MKELQVHNTPIYYIGPELGIPCHNVLYFSLSGPDSLTRAPYCHPAQFLAQQGVRVFSLTLPQHEDDARPQHIAQLWSEHSGELQWFIEQLAPICETLQEEIQVPIRAFVGLSRGALIACHLAARLKRPTYVVGFSPLLRLNEDHPLNVHHLLSQLCHTHVRCYIGHKDTMVGTDTALSFIHQLIDIQQEARTQATAQLVISPSVGRGGHGTLDPQFLEGITWLKRQLDPIS